MEKFQQHWSRLGGWIINLKLISSPPSASSPCQVSGSGQCSHGSRWRKKKKKKKLENLWGKETTHTHIYTHTQTHNRCTFSLDFLPEKTLPGSCGLDSAARPGDLKSVSWLGAASPDEGANNATCSVTP